MLATQLISIELILGVMLFGGCLAWKKTLGDRLCLLAAVPLSFLLSFALSKTGIWNFFGGIVKSILTKSLPGGKIGENAVISLSELGGAFGSSVGAHIMFVLFFWIFLILLGVAIRIVLKKVSFFQNVAIFKEQTHPGFRIGTCAVGAIRSLFVLMISLFPLIALLSIPSSALEKSRDESFSDTYSSEVSTYIEDNLYNPVRKSILMQTARYTGTEAVIKAASDSISTHKVTVKDGYAVKINTNNFLRNILKDGVTGLKIYEYSLNADSYTASDFADAAEILRDISKEDLLMQAGLDYIKQTVFNRTEPGKTDSDDKKNELFEKISDYLSGCSYEEFSQIVLTLSDAVELMTTCEQAKSMAADDEFLFEVLGDEEISRKVTELIAPSDACCEMLQIACEYGLKAICEVLDIRADQQEYYEEFMQDMQTALNEINIEHTDMEAVDLFIAYIAENNITLSDCLPSEDSEKDTDYGYFHYSSYIRKEAEIRKICSDYMLSSKSGSLFFSADKQTVYRYDTLSDLWQKTDLSEITDASGLVIQFLIEELNKVNFASGAQHEMIYPETMEKWIEQGFSGYADPFIKLLSAETGKKAGNLAELFLSKNSKFFRPDMIYSEQIISSASEITIKDSLSKEKNKESFSKMISAAALLLGDVSGAGSDKTLTSTVLANFSDIGVLLDAMTGFDMTSKLTSQLLTSISYNKNYRSYFTNEIVVEMIDSIEQGHTTYESLFATIESLFKIVSGVIS